jgi:hypothetical protein
MGFIPHSSALLFLALILGLTFDRESKASGFRRRYGAPKQAAEKVETADPSRPKGRSGC